jgi:hypothetical protein
MSIWRVVVSAVFLAAAACAEPIAAPDESDVEQDTGVPPACPAGDSTITWTEQTGVCGQCLLRGKVGTPFATYGACASNIPGTKKLLSTSCQTPCLID